MATKSEKPRPVHFMREWRLRRGMSQAALAEAAGVVTSQISRYESGEQGITFEIQLRIMEALNIRPDEFFVRPPATPDDREKLRRRQFWLRDHKRSLEE